MRVSKAIQAINRFQGESLTMRLAGIETDIAGFDRIQVSDLCATWNIDDSFLGSALAVKKVASQINVIIHAAGILCALPKILKASETVESVSLGAGNTGRLFDLETNERVAEFKFINWQGGPESIRQNSIFKDFFSLAEYETKKEKYLYVVGIHYPMKFLQGRRALSSVLSKQPEIARRIHENYGQNVKVVRDYFELKKDNVKIVDVSPYIGRDV